MGQRTIDPDDRAGPSDAELLRLAGAGDEEAFVTIYRRHHQRVYRFALHLSGNQAVAEETTQEVFLFLLRSDHGYRVERGSLGAFLCGVARNIVRRFLDRGSNETTLSEELEADLAADDQPTLVHREQMEVVRRAVLALPADYREVVVLCDLEEMSYADAAQVLDCPIGTVRSRLHRARALLLAKLSAQLGMAAGQSGKVKCAG